MSIVGTSTNPVASTPGWLDWVEEKLLAAVEHLNPILIKEARQALKSRQFIITFSLTLFACWVVSIGVLFYPGPEIFYAASGDLVLAWYCAILAFPLFVVVPYSAYRSITIEQEDNTYELLSITSLCSRQIITGKLGSSIVQMIVYLCAASPCICFTFLLRGVDLQLIAFIILSYALVSLGASMIALTIGTAAKVRHTQALTSVLVVLALFGMLVGCVTLTFDFIESSDEIFRDSDFWISTAAILTIYVTTFLLLHAAAGSQIAFSSENRSSRLRWLMLLQVTCCFGWFAGIAATNWTAFRLAYLSPVSIVITLVAAGYWYFMGTLMTSEWPHLSRRVQRSLPQSRAGQILLTWFNPGPGTGFMFAVANLTAVVLASLGALLFANTNGARAMSDQAICVVGFTWCYVVIFLGTGALLISLLRKFLFISMTAGFLLHVILLLLACAIPQFIALASSSYGRGETYTILQGSNPFWTLIEAAGSSGFSRTPEANVLAVVLPATALVILMLCLRLVAVDVRYRRRTLPARVAEEEAALHPAPAIRPSSPWGVDEEA